MTTYITDIKQANTVLAQNDIKLITFANNICYDLDLSAIYYNDFVSGATGNCVQSFGSRQTDYLVVYGDDISQNDSYYDTDYLESLTIDELTELLDSIEYYNYDEDDKDDMIYQLSQIDNEDYYERHFSASRWYDLDSNFTIQGYSQGDNIAVKLLGNANEYITDEYLTNLFYDTPVSGTIEIFINGDLVDELYISEYLDNEYDYDKVQLINNISNATLDKEYHSLLNEYLVNNLDDELKYSY